MGPVRGGSTAAPASDVDDHNGDRGRDRRDRRVRGEARAPLERPLMDKPNLHDWGPLVDDVRARKQTALAMGGDERIARQRSLGKLPVRERIDLLLDDGSFIEYGLLADHMDPSLADRGSLAA